MGSGFTNFMSQFGQGIGAGLGVKEAQTGLTGWSNIANQLGQYTGNYARQQSPVGAAFIRNIHRRRSRLNPDQQKSAEDMLQELSGRGSIYERR